MCPCSKVLQMNLLNIGYVSNETNTDVCMYTWRIYSRWSALLDVQVGTEILYGKYTGIYTNATKEEKCKNCSWKTIDRVVLIELQRHEKLSLEWTNVWSVIPLFASCLTPVSVNGNHGNHIDSMPIKQLEKLLNVILTISIITWQDKRWI